MCVHTGDAFDCHCGPEWAGVNVRFPDPKHYPTTYKVELLTHGMWFPFTIDLTWDDVEEVYGEMLRTQPEKYRVVKIDHVVELVEIKDADAD